MKAKISFRFLFAGLLALLTIRCTKDHQEHVQQMTGTDQAMEHENMIMLNDSQVRLANVTTRTAAETMIGQTVILNARLTVNEERSGFISSWFAGRIDKLYIKETGRQLKSGEPFMEVYSESLISMQREYLLARDEAASQKNDSRYAEFEESARNKLIRYGLTPSQLERLAKTREVNDYLTIYAPAGGVISKMSVSEGQYVGEGTELYQVEDIRQLWVEAELYPGETNLAHNGDKVVVRVAGFDDAGIETRVIFVSPEFRNNSQVILMRAAIDNPQGVYRPGMQAQVVVTHSARKALAIPVDAVIREAHVNYVFVNSDKNSFMLRPVGLGLEDADRVEILSGLKEGETVVITGAYLLYSELVLRGGIAAKSGHQHD